MSPTPSPARPSDPTPPPTPVSAKPVEATSQRTVDQLIFLLGGAMLLAVGATVWVSIVTHKIGAVDKLATLLIGGLMGALTTDAVRRRRPDDPPEMHDPPYEGTVTFAPDPAMADPLPVVVVTEAAATPEPAAADPPPLMLTDQDLAALAAAGYPPAQIAAMSDTDLRLVLASLAANPPPYTPGG